MSADHLVAVPDRLLRFDIGQERNARGKKYGILVSTVHVVNLPICKHQVRRTVEVLVRPYMQYARVPCWRRRPGAQKGHWLHTACV